MNGKRAIRWLSPWVVLALVLPVALLAQNPSPPRSSQTPAEKPAAQSGTPTEARSTTPAAPAPAAQEPTGGAAGTSEANQLFIEFKYGVNGTDVQGNRDRSFLHQGINHTFDFSFFTNQEVLGVRRFEVLSVMRYSDDPRVDPERNSVQRAYARLSGPTFEMNFGDYMVNYSRFSFNQNIKGLNAWKRLPVGKGLKLTATAGVFTDRWGAVFRSFREIIGNPAQPPTSTFPSKPFTRLVLGARAEQRIIDDTKFIALNFSQGSDVIRSLPRDASFTPINNKLFSIDGEALFRRLRSLRLAGEVAYSLTNFDTRRAHGLDDGWARRFEAAQRVGKLNWRVDFARFGPRFFSANARQVQDLQDFGFRASWEFNRNFMVTGSWRRTNDNLNERRPFTTRVRTPEIRATIRNLPFYPRMIIEAGYRERNIDASVLCTATTTGCADRTTRIPFVDLSMPFGSTIFNLSYEHRHNRDHLTRPQSTFTHRVLLGYRGSYFWKNWTIAPFVRFEMEREEKSIQTAPSAATFKDGFDTNRSIQGGFTLEAPKYFVIEGLYREFNAVNLLLVTPTAANLSLFQQLLRTGDTFGFGNGGFLRPSFRGSISYKIKNDENKVLTISFERNANRFAISDPTLPDDRSFRETIIMGTVLIRFRR